MRCEARVISMRRESSNHIHETRKLQSYFMRREAPIIFVRREAPIIFMRREAPIISTAAICRAPGGACRSSFGLRLTLRNDYHERGRGIT